MSASRSSGTMIVLEGIDGCGKSTLIKRLLDEHPDWIGVASPSWTGTGSDIRQVLSGKAPHPGAWALQLMFAVDRYEIARALRDDLDAGKTILCDRWWYSGLVYGSLDGLRAEDVATLYRYLDVVPDLVIHLDVDPAVSVAREGKGAGADLYDGDLTRQTTLAELYREHLSKGYYADWLRLSHEPYYLPPCTIDANQPLDVVQKAVLDAIEARCAGPVRSR